MNYFDLYLSFLKIGLISFGGGYASLTMVKGEIVDNLMWLNQTEFLDMLTIAEITPGPIALNSATFVGAKSLGIIGAICATAGFLTAPVIITAIMGGIYFKYNKTPVTQGVLSVLRPAAAGLIASAAASVISSSVINGNSINITAACAAVIGFIIMRRFKPNPVFVIVLAGAAGVVLYS